MRTIPRCSFLFAVLVTTIVAERAAAQTLQPAVRGSVQDQNADGKGDKIHDMLWHGLLRRDIKLEDRAVVEFDLSAFQGQRLANVVVSFELAVNNAGGARMRTFDVVIYSGKGKVELDTFAAKAKVVRSIIFSIEENPSGYRLEVTKQAQEVLESGAKFVGLRLNPLGDNNFPSILDKPALHVKTEAAVALERKIDKLIQQLADDDFKYREAASAELLKIGAPARPQLEKAARGGVEVEMRRRAKSLLKQLPR